ncbi:MAG TPA: hypothetical protein VK422_10815 [Pyrinomonadaceae bacterium]|nr:hypothetical protein [Pyrinomonadaceae bacterium]
MSIAHELSSEVAAAVLAAGEGEAPQDASGRAEVVLEVHSTLRRLSAENRKRGRSVKDGPEGPARGEGASSGRH